MLRSDRLIKLPIHQQVSAESKILGPFRFFVFEARKGHVRFRQVNIGIQCAYTVYSASFDKPYAKFPKEFEKLHKMKFASQFIRAENGRKAILPKSQILGAVSALTWETSVETNHFSE